MPQAGQRLAEPRMGSGVRKACHWLGNEQRDTVKSAGNSAANQSQSHKSQVTRHKPQESVAPTQGYRSIFLARSLYSLDTRNKYPRAPERPLLLADPTLYLIKRHEAQTSQPAFGCPLCVNPTRQAVHIYAGRSSAAPNWNELPMHHYHYHYQALLLVVLLITCLL